MIAQCTALSRLIPLMYFILVVNSWMLAASFWEKAPLWLTLYASSALTVVCGIRIVAWWRSRGETLTFAKARKELTRLPILTAALAVAFTSWAFALFPYGDASAKGHVVFYLTISLISTMFCLIHVRSAALILAGIAGTIIVTFLVLQNTLIFHAIALNITLVTIAAVIVILIQSRDFVRMVNALARSEALSDENLRLANIDSLTDLPNRRAFFSQLNESFRIAEKYGTRLALGVIDLDGFKPVNDLYGHAVGDKLLAEVADRLSKVFSKGSMFTARLGGDEFAFIISDAPDDETLIRRGNEIGLALRSPFSIPEATIQISGSVGIAVYPEMASSSDQLYERADYALYHGKHTQRGGATLFAASHEARVNSDAKIEQALKLADFDRELSVVFQPIIDVRNQATIGFEALARWSSPLVGVVSPAQFIPVAERAGIVSSITRPLLKKALESAASWSDEIRLSFNLSAHDLNSAEGVLAIVGIIQGSAFDARRLDLEMTETAFTHDFEQVRRSIEILRLLGCGISLDDFGTGYSSLSRLHSLPLTKIKIDRSFVTGLDTNPASHKIVKSLLALSRDMGLDCVVEGVETREELLALKKLGKVMVQGYYYSRPIERSDVMDFLAAGSGAGSRAVN